MSLISFHCEIMSYLELTCQYLELNGYKLKKWRKVDAIKQIEVALREFESCAYFILVDDLQVKSLDDEVALCADTKVTFIKLTPLVGG